MNEDEHIEASDVNGAKWFQFKRKGETVGFAVASIQGEDLSLDSIHVIPNQRKTKVGTELLSTIIKWGTSLGAKRIKGEFFPEFRGGEDEVAARKFYERHGISIDSGNNLSGRLK